MAYEVSPKKYVTCICGRVCKGRAALANHGRKCPTEIARSEAFITGAETGDYSRYNELTKGTPYELRSKTVAN